MENENSEVNYNLMFRGDERRLCINNVKGVLPRVGDKENSGNYVTFSPEFSNGQFSKTSNTNNRIVHTYMVDEDLYEVIEIRHCIRAGVGRIINADRGEVSRCPPEVIVSPKK